MFTTLRLEEELASKNIAIAKLNQAIREQSATIEKLLEENQKLDDKIKESTCNILKLKHIIALKDSIIYRSKGKM